MSTLSAKPVIHECCLVKRRLRLEAPDRRTMESIRVALEELPTVAWASVAKGGRRLDVAYDASTDSVDHVLEIVRERGGQLSQDWWTRFRVDSYRFTDKNVKDNLRQEPASCHSVPTVRTRRGVYNARR